MSMSMSILNIIKSIHQPPLIIFIYMSTQQAKQ